MADEFAPSPRCAQLSHRYHASISRWFEPPPRKPRHEQRDRPGPAAPRAGRDGPDGPGPLRRCGYTDGVPWSFVHFAAFATLVVVACRCTARGRAPAGYGHPFPGSAPTWFSGAVAHVPTRFFGRQPGRGRTLKPRGCSGATGPPRTARGSWDLRDRGAGLVAAPVGATRRVGVGHRLRGPDATASRTGNPSNNCPVLLI